MTAVPDVACDVLVGFLIAGDGTRAQGLVDSMVSQGIPLVAVISDLLGPALARVGLEWQYGSVAVAVEHRATSISEGILSRLVATTESPATAGRVWLTGVEGEWHTMPTRLVAAVWQCLGWEVVALTPSLPAQELRLLAGSDETTLAGLSCSLPSNLVPAWQTISVLRETGFRIVAGGRAFEGVASLAESLGADAHCSDPIEASRVLGRWGPLPAPSARQATLLAAWEELRQTWEELPSVVENAVLIACELDDVSQPTEVLRQDLGLLARTAVAAALCEEPALLAMHLRWHSGLSSRWSGGLDPRLLVSALGRVLPAGERLRSVLDEV